MFSGGDPFRKPGGRANLQNKDYTKFIKWTPLKITIAALCIALPYLGIVIAIASAISIGAAMPLIVIPFILVLFVGLVYGVGLLGQVKPQRKTSRRKR
jgi:hypothetical protein